MALLKVDEDSLPLVDENGKEIAVSLAEFDTAMREAYDFSYEAIESAYYWFAEQGEDCAYFPHGLLAAAVEYGYQDFMDAFGDAEAWEMFERDEFEDEAAYVEVVARELAEQMEDFVPTYTDTILGPLTWIPLG